MKAKVGSKCKVVRGRWIQHVFFEQWRSRKYLMVLFEDNGSDFYGRFELSDDEMREIMRKHDYLIAKAKTRYHIAKVLRRKRDSKRIMDKTIYKKVKTI